MTPQSRITSPTGDVQVMCEKKILAANANGIQCYSYPSFHSQKHIDSHICFVATFENIFHSRLIVVSSGERILIQSSLGHRFFSNPTFDPRVKYPHLMGPWLLQDGLRLGDFIPISIYWMILFARIKQRFCYIAVCSISSHYIGGTPKKWLAQIHGKISYETWNLRSVVP